jgi:hypothetical protein
MSNKKQAAVEWLAEYLTNKGYINAPTFTHKLIDEAINQAKIMEKQQIIDAFNVGFDDGCGFIEELKYKDGEQYYKETYEQ